MTILPRKQSDNLNQRLRRLCSVGIAGTQIRKTINTELGLHWTLQAYWGRVRSLDLQWKRTEKAGQPHPSTEYLAEGLRQACYRDPAYEGRNKILDRVICRECFAKLRDGAMDGKRGHLWTIHEKMSLNNYYSRHPGVRIFTFERIAQQQKIDIKEYLAKEVENYATPDELAEAQTNHRYEDDHGITQYVICRMERCGFKSIARLDKHLRNAHDMDTKEYRREHHWPIMTGDEHIRKAKLARERMGELKDAEAKLARQKSRKKPEGTTQVEQIGPAVEAAISRFTWLVAGQQLSDGLTALEVDATKYASGSRGARKDRPMIAARYLVSAQRNLEYDNVAWCHQEYRRRQVIEKGSQ